jgi:hypothetical protein
MGDTLKAQLNTRWAALDQDASSWIGHWRDLCDYVMPRMARFLVTDRNKGYKANQKILNETATFSVRATARGMMSKITNPARPWIKLKTANEELNHRQDVRMWLDVVTDRVLQVFLRSNLYTVLPLVYQDLLLYGTGCFVVEQDTDTVIRCEMLPIGSYRLALGGDGRVTTCYREFQMTRAQLVEKFGLHNVSEQVATAMKTKNGTDVLVTIRHCVEPNPEFVPDALLARFFKFRSVWYEVGSNDDKFLRRSGFNSFAVIAPRWAASQGDVYGHSPAMDVLGSIKELQLLEKRSLQLLDKVITPALNVPVELRRKEINQFSGGLNFVAGPNQKIEPLHTIQSAPLQHVEAKIQRLEDRIRKGLYEDVFMAMSGIDSARTAEEIRARIDEKIQSIGPILLTLNDELLDTLVERTYEIMQQPEFKGLIPEPPEALAGAPLTVEYISELAQAMKLNGVVGIERVMGFARENAEFYPQGLDNVNIDEVMNIYTDMSGAPVRILNDEKVVAQIRADRAAQQQQQQQIEQSNVQADTMKKMAEAPTSGENALTEVAGVF